jgi:hypothetical protein
MNNSFAIVTTIAKKKPEKVRPSSTKLIRTCAAGVHEQRELKVVRLRRAGWCDKDKLSVGVRGALSFVTFLCASKEKFKNVVCFSLVLSFAQDKCFSIHECLNQKNKKEMNKRNEQKNCTLVVVTL